MKTILKSAGLAALGAASLQAADNARPSPTGDKPYSLSASLRGFYDDNYTSSGGNLRTDSFGFEVRPSASLNWNAEQTQIGASYTYSLKYYEDRVNNRADHAHLFDISLNHEFTENYRLTLYDNLAVAQEGMVLDPAQRIQALRVNGNNVRNIAGADFRADISRQIALEPGYSFTLYDYQQKGANSYSARLDRHEHMFKLGLRWKEIAARTDGILGYQFGMTDYTSNDTLGGLSPSVRDTRSHYYFAGVDHTLNPQVTLSLRAGAQTVDYRGTQSTRTSPYVDLNGTYRFSERSSAQLGYKLSRIATDQFLPVGGQLTVDQYAHFLYGRLSHSVGDLTLGAGLQWQYGKYRGGLLNSQAEDILSADLSALYRINNYLYAEAGYVFEMLHDHGFDTVAVPNRDFHRNIIYLGLKATY